MACARCLHPLGGLQPQEPGTRTSHPDRATRLLRNPTPPPNSEPRLMLAVARLLCRARTTQGHEGWHAGPNKGKRGMCEGDRRRGGDAAESNDWCARGDASSCPRLTTHAAGAAMLSPLPPFRTHRQPAQRRCQNWAATPYSPQPAAPGRAQQTSRQLNGGVDAARPSGAIARPHQPPAGCSAPVIHAVSSPLLSIGSHFHEGNVQVENGLSRKTRPGIG